MKKNITVLILTSGIPYRIFLISEVYREAGFNVDINMLSLGIGKKVESISGFVINYIRFPKIFSCNRLIKWIYMWLMLPFVLREKLKSSQYLYIDSYTLLPVAFIVKILWRHKIILDQKEIFHTVSSKKLDKYKEKLKDIFERLFISVVDIVYTMDSHKSFWKKRYQDMKKNVIVIMNVPSKNSAPIDLTPNSLIKKRSDSSVELIYVGNINNNSGIENIIYALNSLPSNFNLNLIGYQDKDYVNFIINLARREGLDNRIKFGNWIPYEKLIETISYFHIGLMTKPPSKGQYGLIGRGNSRKVFTYMHAGLPVIAPDHKSVALQVEEEACGKRIDVENPKEIAKAIIEIYQNHRYYKEMVANAVQSIMNKYNWELEQNKIKKSISWIT